MKINRKEIRRMILQEMDMSGMGIDMEAAYQAFQALLVIGGMGVSLLSMLMMLGPVMFHGFLDGYFRGLFSEAEYKKFVELSRENPEAAKRYANHVISKKGYDPAGGSVPVHSSGDIDTRHARDYNEMHGDIIDFDEDDY
jgi:hypothetical protein